MGRNVTLRDGTTSQENDRALGKKGKHQKRTPSTKQLSPPSAPQFTRDKPPPNSEPGATVWALAKAAEDLLDSPFPVTWGRACKALKPHLEQLGRDEILSRWCAFLTRTQNDSFLAGNRTIAFFASRINSDWTVTRYDHRDPYQRRERERADEYPEPQDVHPRSL